jgi:hypothetical protein
MMIFGYIWTTNSVSHSHVPPFEHLSKPHEAFWPMYDSKRLEESCFYIWSASYIQSNKLQCKGEKQEWQINYICTLWTDQITENHGGAPSPSSFTVYVNGIAIWCMLWEKNSTDQASQYHTKWQLHHFIPYSSKKEVHTVHEVESSTDVLHRRWGPIVRSGDLQMADTKFLKMF